MAAPVVVVAKTIEPTRCDRSLNGATNLFIFEIQDDRISSYGVIFSEITSHELAHRMQSITIQNSFENFDCFLFYCHLYFALLENVKIVSD